MCLSGHSKKGSWSWRFHHTVSGVIERVTNTTSSLTILTHVSRIRLAFSILSPWQAAWVPVITGWELCSRRWCWWWGSSSRWCRGCWTWTKLTEWLNTRANVRRNQYLQLELVLEHIVRICIVRCNRHQILRIPYTIRLSWLWQHSEGKTEYHKRDICCCK